jgi:hypothetical protein
MASTADRSAVSDSSAAMSDTSASSPSGTTIGM